MASGDKTRNHRHKLDIMKLIANMHDTAVSDDMQFLIVKFHGPNDTPYKNGMWKVHVFLPDNYPFQSPSIGFEKNKIFHPNIDLVSGTVCLDVINQKWSPMYDLVNIFETFLPQLLRYPNPEDPLNHTAANMLLKDLFKFRKYVKNHVFKYAGIRDELNEVSPDTETSDLSEEESLLSEF